MEIGININESNEITAYYFNGIDGDVIIEVDETVLNLIDEGRLLKYENNEFIVDINRETKLENDKEIQNLKRKLADTDYVVIKISEYNHTGADIPDEYDQVLVDRQVWRDRINELEEEIKEL